MYKEGDERRPSPFSRRRATTWSRQVGAASLLGRVSTPRWRPPSASSQPLFRLPLSPPLYPCSPFLREAMLLASRCSSPTPLRWPRRLRPGVACSTHRFAAAAQDALKLCAYRQASSALPFVPMSVSFGRLEVLALKQLGGLAGQAAQAGRPGLFRAAFISGVGTWPKTFSDRSNYLGGRLTPSGCRSRSTTYYLSLERP
jgi:hypothetical protein